MTDCNKYECDRCHKTVDGDEIRTLRYRRGYMDSVFYAHLCKLCNKSLKNWMRMKI